MECPYTAGCTEVAGFVPKLVSGFDCWFCRHCDVIYPLMAGLMFIVAIGVIYALVKKVR